MRPDPLTRIEDRLDRIEALLARIEQQCGPESGGMSAAAAAAILGGPDTLQAYNKKIRKNRRKNHAGP